MSSSQSVPYRASYDTTTKVLSAAVCLILAAIVVASHSALAGGIGLLIVVLSYAWSPQGYAICDRSIIVRRLIGAARISLDGIREARAATKDDFRCCIRLWGSGGLFGYYGLFRTAKLGKSTWYVTNRNRAVVVVTDAKTVVLSPDDVERFLAEVRAWAPVPAMPPAVIFANSIPERVGGNQIGSFLGLAIVLLAAGVVAFAMLYAPGLPRYTLTPQSLSIHDRFYPVTVEAAAVDVDRIEVVDIGADGGWRPVSRANGFANAHYRSGWFRVANGQKVRMYRAGGTRLVLLPPKGNGVAVLLEVKDPDRFAVELRQQWGRSNG